MCTMCMSVALGDQERASDRLELELLGARSCLMWVLLGPLQEQLVLLITEPSPAPKLLIAVGNSQYELLKQSTVFIS